MAHININSFRNKFVEIHEIMEMGYVDFLAIAETKLDYSFVSAQYHVPSYAMYRRDRNANGGGLLIYIKQSIPHRVRCDLIPTTCLGIECMILEVRLSKNSSCSKRFIVTMYRPPNVHVSNLQRVLTEIIDKTAAESSQVYVLGDLNVDFSVKTNALTDTLDVLHLSNLIEGPTCYKSVNNPSSVDVVLTNCPRSVLESMSLHVGISDFHDLVVSCLRVFAPPIGKRTFTYRSFKGFDEGEFLRDLKSAPFHVAEMFDELDDRMDFHNSLFKKIADSHAPIKTKTVCYAGLPYMNNELRRAINNKHHLQRKYVKTGNGWSEFKRQRNKVNGLKKEAKKTYFDKYCSSQRNSGEFWRTVQPVISDKASNGRNKIILTQGEDLLTSPTEVSGALNEYFTNCTNELAEAHHCDNPSAAEWINFYREHPSVQLIQSSQTDSPSEFDFRLVSVEEVNEKIKHICERKSSGYDSIPLKLIRLSAPVLSKNLQVFFNYAILNKCIPICVKRAVVTPVFKKGNNLLCENYRPISVLTGFASVFEGLLCDQISGFFEEIACNQVSAYRPLYSCSSVLMQMIEEWKLALDCNEVVGCIAMDMSKAFDCLPHGLLCSKLRAYGFSMTSVEVIYSYLSGRYQCCKVENVRSEWLPVLRGVPQGSRTGPILFNFFMNDLIISLNSLCQIYNYADDNTLSYHNADSHIVQTVLQSSINKCTNWFSQNCMKANGRKFQAMILSRSRFQPKMAFKIDGTVIESQAEVKILGMKIDDKLCFNSHISMITKQISGKVNSMLRLTKLLNSQTKLNLYHAFVLSGFSYCASIYHFCNVSDALKLEKLNQRAVRIVFNDYTTKYYDLLVLNDMLPLFLLREMEIVMCVFRVLHELYPPFKNNFFLYAGSFYNLRDSTIILRKCNTTTYGLNSFKYAGANMFNRLPFLAKNYENFKDFKSNIRNKDYFKCECRSCRKCTVIYI